MEYFSNTKTALRRMLALALSLVLLFSGPLPLAAQTVDTEPPQLQFDAIEQGVVGDEQLFVITASDNVELESVTFTFRFEDGANYQRRSMERQGATDTYTVSLSPEEIGSEGTMIQYYIVAQDLEGNRTLEGFSFSPLTRNLVDRSEIAQTSAPSQQGVFAGFSNLPTSTKLIYGALGVLAVGVLVAASDSDGSGDTTSTGTDVTVVVDPLR
ncbi:MAG: hypothetical protein KTR32_04665 [Granulosicoccus sp.]|nr:hypothetical protein [Granulosicoccus sp.]